MARKLLLFLWFSTVLLPTFSQWSTIAYFQINKQYIARVLCENRDRPELHCDGQCYLARRLKAQQEKEDQQTAEQVQNLPVVQLFTPPLERFAFPTPLIYTPDQPVFTHQLRAYWAFLPVLPHPPQLTA
ncbi:hypothetical protein ACFQ4C_21510 [Larkinella insperata]|uniref:Uncharacterized protein n=1 Tax=Larkinella insperata TaxID=332158 RepID=A0ABW3QHE1_9BACT